MPKEIIGIDITKSMIEKSIENYNNSNKQTNRRPPKGGLFYCKKFDIFATYVCAHTEFSKRKFCKGLE